MDECMNKTNNQWMNIWIVQVKLIHEIPLIKPNIEINETMKNELMKYWNNKIMR